MAVQLLKRLLTLEEYYLIGKTGILPEGDRVELIEGELVQMAAIGTRDAGCVNGYSLIQKLGRGQQVSPLAFPDWEVNIDFILG